MSFPSRLELNSYFVFMSLDFVIRQVIQPVHTPVRTNETPRNKLQAWITRSLHRSYAYVPRSRTEKRDQKAHVTPKIKEEKRWEVTQSGRPTTRPHQRRTRIRMVSASGALLTLHSCSELMWMSPVCSPARARLSLNRPASNDSIALYKSQVLLVSSQIDN